MVGLFVRVDLEDLPNTIVVIPLLKKFFFISNWVSLYQILKLWQVCSEQDASTHGKYVVRLNKTQKTTSPPD
jgi:hypothetical protein